MSDEAGASVARTSDVLFETIKQVLTLSATILSFTVIFRREVSGDVLPADETWLSLAWAAFVVAIVCGVYALYACAGVSRDVGSLAAAPVVRVAALIQFYSFVAGLVLLAIFGAATVFGAGPGAETPGSCAIVAPAVGECTVPPSG